MVSLLIGEEGPGAGFGGSGSSPALQPAGLSSLEAGKGLTNAMVGQTYVTKQINIGITR